MSAFSSDAVSSLERKADVGEESIITEDNDLRSVYELDRCVSWIQEIGAKKVCLQFPDALLGDSAKVALHLERLGDWRVAILGDTSYGGCCVDAVAAQHFKCDALIHFGPACLSPTRRLPVLHVFGKRRVDVAHLVACFRGAFAADSRVLILYDTAYSHAMAALRAELSPDFPHSVWSRLATSAVAMATETRRLGRDFTLADGTAETDYVVLYVGQDGQTLANFMLDIPGREYHLYDPESAHPSISAHTRACSKFLRRRLYLVERVKDANTLGIVVGTLGVDDYLSAVDRVKRLAKRANKKCYIIAVGKPNVPKLANFPEVDVFVLVSCPENSLLDSKEFYRPIVTPYDVELAMNPALDIGRTYVTDFREMLPGGRQHTDVDNMSHQLSDVSLISGRLRPPTSDRSSSDSTASDSLAVRADATVAIPDSTGGRFLGARSWRGLQPGLGETEVTLALPGRRGIAQNYQEEEEQ